MIVLLYYVRATVITGCDSEVNDGPGSVTTCYASYTHVRVELNYHNSTKTVSRIFISLGI